MFVHKYYSTRKCKHFRFTLEKSDCAQTTYTHVQMHKPTHIYSCICWKNKDTFSFHSTAFALVCVLNASACQGAYVNIDVHIVTITRIHMCVCVSICIVCVPIVGCLCTYLNDTQIKWNTCPSQCPSARLFAAQLQPLVGALFHYNEGGWISARFYAVCVCRP